MKLIYIYDYYIYILYIHTFNSKITQKLLNNHYEINLNLYLIKKKKVNYF